MLGEADRLGVGFVGNGEDKFTADGEVAARSFIGGILAIYHSPVMVSGHAPVGGVDIWAEVEAIAQGIPLDLKVPTTLQWDPPGGYGFKARNIDIARDSDVLYVVLADVLPEAYKGRRFKECYHCARIGDRDPTDHVKSGGCWTGKKALELGKTVIWKIIQNYPS